MTSIEDEINLLQLDMTLQIKRGNELAQQLAELQDKHNTLTRYTRDLEVRMVNVEAALRALAKASDERHNLAHTKLRELIDGHNRMAMAQDKLHPRVITLVQKQTLFAAALSWLRNRGKTA